MESTAGQATNEEFDAFHGLLHCSDVHRELLFKGLHGLLGLGALVLRADKKNFENHFLYPAPQHAS